MKKGFYIVIAALLVLSLTACGKSKSTNSVPLVDCSDRGSAVEGGCYLMTETSLDKGTQRKTTENELPSLPQCTA